MTGKIVLKGSSANYRYVKEYEVEVRRAFVKKIARGKEKAKNKNIQINWHFHINIGDDKDYKPKYG